MGLVFTTYVCKVIVNYRHEVTILTKGDFGIVAIPLPQPPAHPLPPPPSLKRKATLRCVLSFSDVFSLVNAHLRHLECLMYDTWLQRVDLQAFNQICQVAFIGGYTFKHFIEWKRHFYW